MKSPSESGTYADAGPAGPGIFLPAGYTGDRSGRVRHQENRHIHIQDMYKKQNAKEEKMDRD